MGGRLAGDALIYLVDSSDAHLVETYLNSHTVPGSVHTQKGTASTTGKSMIRRMVSVSLVVLMNVIYGDVEFVPETFHLGA